MILKQFMVYPAVTHFPKKLYNDQTLLPSVFHQQWHLSPKITSTVSEYAEEDSETGIV